MRAGWGRILSARLRREIASAGATDPLTAVYPVGDDVDASVARTRALLKGLVGKV